MAYNKSDLVTKIAQKSHLTKAQAEAAVNAFQDVFVEAMKSGEGLKLTGLFSAERVKRRPHRPQPAHRRDHRDPSHLWCAYLRWLPAQEGRHRVTMFA